MVNDVYLDGREHDLSAFGTDLANFTDLQISVRNKKLAVAINGSDVYQTDYKESMGRVVGLRFKFLGLGEVNSLTLMDQGGSTVSLR